MGVEQMLEAVWSVHDDIRGGVDAKQAVLDACETYSVPEPGLRVRFERQFGVNPEAYSLRKFEVVDSVSKAKALASAHGLHPSRTLHAGKPFRLRAKDDDTGEWHTSKPYFFICSRGIMVEALDGDTNKVVEIYGPEFLKQIAAQTGWQYER